MSEDLAIAAVRILRAADPHEKARLTQDAVTAWRATPDAQAGIGLAVPPDRPGRPEKPELLSPGQMPKRRDTVTLLHALAHIELNAIDLAWDIIARFTHLSWQNAAPGAFALPRAFYDDWCGVAYDEARHFIMLSKRLADLGAAYGDFPAHDGLWESATRTAHDIAARLAVVPMVLEARGLDVTPTMIKNTAAKGDHQTSAILQTIHEEEITHVRAGTHWFDHWCRFHGKDPETAWQDLVRAYFKGSLKRPFNDDSREKAGMVRDWYEQLADEADSARN